jgi:hypothetical protein
MTRRIPTLAVLAPLWVLLLATTAAAQKGPVAAAPIEIAPGETITGNLDAQDPLLADGSHYECYVVTGAPGSSVMVTMRSTVFDTYLLALPTDVAGCGDVPAEGAFVQDDDGGGGTDAQLTLTFDGTGRFLIAANSYEAGATGTYTLTLDAVAAGGGGTKPGTPAAAAAPAAPPAPVAAPAPAVISK